MDLSTYKQFSANLQAFLASCTKDQRGKVTQYCEPIFDDPRRFYIRCSGKTNVEVEDSYPTHADYAKTLQDQRTVTDNNFMIVVNITTIVGTESDQLVNICSFAVRCDRRWPSTQ